MSSPGRREALTVACVAAVAFLPFLRGALWGASLYFRDLSLYFLPLRRLALDGLRRGEVRFWNPYLHEGVPLSLPALGYPVDLLQLLRPDEAGISLVLALHVPLAAVGFYVLGRRLLDAPPPAAAAGAVVYALGGFVLSAVNLYVYVEAAAWAPLVILTLARVFTDGSGRALAGAALVAAVALSTTGVELVAQAVLAGVVLGAWPREGRRLRGFARAGAALALAVLVAAPVLLPVASQVGDSARGRGFETHVVLAQSVHPFSLLQVMVAGLYGNLANLANEWWGQNFFPRGFPYILSLYLGPGAVCLALVGAFGRHPLRTPLVLLAALGLVVCLGRWSGMAVIVDALPALRTLRYPVKAFYTVHLAAALLVSLGLAALGKAGRHRGWTLLAAAAGSLGAVLALAPILPRVLPDTMARFGAAFFPPGLDPAVRGALLSRVLGDAAIGGALALAVAAVAVLARSGRVRHGAVLVAALLAGDLLRAGSGLNPMVGAEFFEPSKELAASLESRRRGRVFSCRFAESAGYREARRTKGQTHELWTFAVALETLTPAFNVPLRVPTAMSPDLTMLVPPERVLPQDDGCRDLDALLPRLRRAGVDTLVSIDPLMHAELAPVGSTAPERLAPLAVHTYRLRAPLPRLSLATRVVAARTGHEGARHAAGAGFLARGGVAVEGPIRASASPGGTVETARISNDHMEVEVHASEPTVLVVRDGWASGWTAWVDGEPAPVMRANGRHRAVPVPAGPSRVALTYRPPGLGVGALGGILGIVILGVLALRGPRVPRLSA